ncbi:class I SAM-dependent methyltransferase [Kallotenue papyrolyticum]|uniref:class I SAM-dependent methyltransferase n=1 Tax=Kallotenue papyrolyticum TaxID=1325125 RepID=UPI0004785452|nr:class I SAM-dependent methyltransferase [Kallotenue papyrolyticum]
MQPISSSRAAPRAADYGQTYFARLYGTVPRQTPIDRLRDWLIHRLVTRHLAGGRLLEIGCGYGYLLGRFADAWTVCGTDISVHAAAIAQRRLPHAHIVAADIQEGIPFAGCFDALIAVNVMEHLPAPERAAQAIAAALRRGGLFVAHLPTISSALAGWIYARTYASDVTHVYRPSGAAFNALVERTGFRVRQSLYCPFWPAGLWRRLRPHPAYLALFERV